MKKTGKLRAEREDQRIVVTHFLRSYIKRKKLYLKKLQNGRENVLTSRRAGAKCGPLDIHYFCPGGRQMCQHEESINGSSCHCAFFCLSCNLWNVDFKSLGRTSCHSHDNSSNLLTSE